AQIQSVQLAGFRAKSIQARRRVIRDRIEQLDIPVLNPAADDLDRGQRIGNGRDQIRERYSGTGEIAVQHKRHFSFRFWLKYSSERYFLAVVELHIGKKHSEVGGIDAELLLDRLGSESYFTAHKPSSLFQMVVGVRLLYSVCGFYASARNFIADWWNRLSRFGRFTKTSSHGVDCFRVYFHVVISLTAFAITIIYALVHTLPE